MSRNSLMCLIGLTLLTVMPSASQTTDEDIALLKDGTLFRGEVRDVITPGGTVILHREDGRKSLLYWNEIVGLRRCPHGIPDSLLRLSLSEPGFVAPRIEMNGYKDFEDVLVLQDTTLARGALLYRNIGGFASLWVQGNPRTIAQSRILKSLNVSRGISDSALIATHVLVAEDREASNRRIVAIFLGASLPLTGSGATTTQGSRSYATGFTAGVQAGFEIVSGVRWLTTLSYSVHARGVDPVLADIDGVPDVKAKARILMVLTGAEIRVFGSTRTIFRGFVQAGGLTLAESGYAGEFPQRVIHPPGTYKVDDVSASSAAVCAGLGGIFGRMEASIRWTWFQPRIGTRTTVTYAGGSDLVTDGVENNPVHLISLEIGINVF